MFAQFLVKTKHSTLVTLKSVCAHRGFSVVTFGGVSENGNIAIAIQGSDKTLPAFMESIMADRAVWVTKNLMPDPNLTAADYGYNPGNRHEGS